jgi:hypothetical protein
LGLGRPGLADPCHDRQLPLVKGRVQTHGRVPDPTCLLEALHPRRPPSAFRRRVRHSCFLGAVRASDQTRPDVTPARHVTAPFLGSITTSGRKGGVNSNGKGGGEGWRGGVRGAEHLSTPSASKYLREPPPGSRVIPGAQRDSKHLESSPQPCPPRLKVNRSLPQHSRTRPRYPLTDPLPQVCSTSSSCTIPADSLTSFRHCGLAS